MRECPWIYPIAFCQKNRTRSVFETGPHENLNKIEFLVSLFLIIKNNGDKILKGKSIKLFFCTCSEFSSIYFKKAVDIERKKCLECLRWLSWIRDGIKGNICHCCWYESWTWWLMQWIRWRWRTGLKWMAEYPLFVKQKRRLVLMKVRSPDAAQKSK